MFQVFSEENESLLEDYLKKAADVYLRLSPLEVRKFASQYANALSMKCIPHQWMENKCAGIDCFQKFMKRHPTISIRTPESTSLARACSFNKTNPSIKAFFANLGTVLDRYKL